MKRWCRSGQTSEGRAGGVRAETRALACKAVAEWEAKKASSGLNADQGKELMVTLEGVMLSASDAKLVQVLAATANIDEGAYERQLHLARAVKVRRDSIGFGSYNHEAVTGLQNRLTALGYDVENDGIFGEATRRAVKEFQRDNRLKRDGLVGTKTYSKLVAGHRRPGRFENPADIGIDAIGRAIDQEGVEADGSSIDTPRSKRRFGTVFRRKQDQRTPGTASTGASRSVPRAGDTARAGQPIGQTDPSRAPGALRDPYGATAQGQPTDAAFEQLHPRGYDGRFASKGSSGQQTRGVQQALNAADGKVRLKVDGEFGSKTDTALRRFQRRHGLRVDGIVGPQTGNALVQARNRSRVVRRIGIRPPKY